MSETTWSEEVAAPPPKKGIPVWVWGCGGGCLLALVVALIGGVFMVGKFKDAFDPEKVWPKVAKVLPFDERPDYTVVGWDFGVEGYVMIDKEEELTGILFITEAEDSADVDQLFKGELEGGGAFGIGEMKDAESLSVDVKGRPCRALRFVSTPPTIPGVPSQAATAIMLVDLSRDPSHFVFLELIDADGEVDQVDVDTFFEPFDPWR